MRIEIVFILWVMAAAAIWGVVSGGEAAENLLTLNPTPIVATTVPAMDGPQRFATAATVADAGTPFDTIAVVDRALFALRQNALPDDGVAAVAATSSLDMVLKGIVRRNGQWQAVFAGLEEPLAYSVVHTGDMLKDFEVIAVEADRVTLARRADGLRQEFELRGAGESP